jgi:HSP90 family molecular chaperone
MSLSNAPVCLAQGQFGMSPSMQKYMKARAVQMGDGDAEMTGSNFAQPSIMQINPSHPVLQKLRESLQVSLDS